MKAVVGGSWGGALAFALLAIACHQASNAPPPQAAAAPSPAASIPAAIESGGMTEAQRFERAATSLREQTQFLGAAPSALNESSARRAVGSLADAIANVPDSARGGSEGRTYPWGKAAPTSQLCWGCVQPSDGTCPVGSFPKGDAPGGIHDLAGNVWEWTFRYAQAYSVARGGGWKLPISPSGPDAWDAWCKAVVSARDGGAPAESREFLTVYQARSRMEMMPSRRAADLGFRCAW